MKKDTKKVKPGKTDKPEKKSKKQAKKAVEEPKATKTRKSRKAEEPEMKPTKQAKVKKAVEDTKVTKTRKNREVVEKVTPTNTGFEGMSLDELRKERHHIAAKISGWKKAGKDVTELKEQEKVIVEMLKKIKYAGTPTVSTKAKTKNVVVEPTRIVETPKTPKVIMVTDLNMDEQPSNEIWYATNDGKPVNITVGNFGKGVVAISNTFDGKNGVIRCDGVITAIGHLTFYGCKNLTSVILPELVEEIDTFAFANCENLTNLICKPTTPPLMGLNIFGNKPNKCTIRVKSKQVKNYKSANGWTAYKDDIRAI